MGCSAGLGAGDAGIEPVHSPSLQRSWFRNPSFAPALVMQRLGCLKCLCHQSMLFGATSQAELRCRWSRDIGITPLLRCGFVALNLCSHAPGSLWPWLLLLPCNTKPRQALAPGANIYNVQVDPLFWYASCLQYLSPTDSFRSIN